jgi:hypothetical protein
MSRYLEYAFAFILAILIAIALNVFNNIVINILRYFFEGMGVFVILLSIMAVKKDYKTIPDKDEDD